MERIGIYGGAFNPLHTGHLAAAKYAVSALRLDRLLLIPTGDPPHKCLPADSPNPAQRLEMLRLAVKDEPKITVSDIELSRTGTSYTVDTVTQLRGQYPNAQLVLLMGTDMFLSFLNWKEPERMIKDTSIGVFCRGYKGEHEQLLDQKAKLLAMGADVVLLENPITDISSTQLRCMLAFGCAAPFLPEGTADYILKNGLYGTDRCLHGLSMEELESVVVSLLKPGRVAHVLGCRDTAVELAQLWGVSVEIAARAALLHDITKALDGPLQLTLCAEYGIILDKFSAENSKTLHALTGSLVAERIFGESPAVVDAIRSHTTGKADMNMLEKIIYVADYMEPNRDFPGVDRLRRLAYTDMDGALRLGLTMTLEHLKRQGREVSPESLEALAYLDNRQ